MIRASTLCALLAACLLLATVANGVEDVPTRGRANAVAKAIQPYDGKYMIPGTGTNARTIHAALLEYNVMIEEPFEDNKPLNLMSFKMMGKGKLPKLSEGERRGLAYHVVDGVSALAKALKHMKRPVRGSGAPKDWGDRKTQVDKLIKWAEGQLKLVKEIATTFVDQFGNAKLKNDRDEWYKIKQAKVYQEALVAMGLAFPDDEMSSASKATTPEEAPMDPERRAAILESLADAGLADKKKKKKQGAKDEVEDDEE